MQAGQLAWERDGISGFLDRILFSSTLLWERWWNCTLNTKGYLNKPTSCDADYLQIIWFWNSTTGKIGAMTIIASIVNN